MKYDIIFLGGGQSGIFGAYEAKKINPNLKILVVDKGKMLVERICPKETLGKCINCKTCAIIFGVSGAGAFSDSKFNLDYKVGGDVHKLVDKLKVNEIIQYVVSIYKKFGFSEEASGLKYNTVMEKIKRKCIENRIQLIDTPTMHLGTDGSRKLYTELINELLEKGVEFKTERDIRELVIEDGKIKGVKCFYKEKIEEYFSENVLLALGRSGAHEVMEMCHKYGIDCTNGAIDIGIRVEIPDIVMKEINENFYEAKMIYYTKNYRKKN